MDEELKGIVAKMVESGESEENIKLVIQNYSVVSGRDEEQVGKPQGSEEQPQQQESSLKEPTSQSETSQEDSQTASTSNVPLSYEWGGEPKQTELETKDYSTTLGDKDITEFDITQEADVEFPEYSRQEELSSLINERNKIASEYNYAPTIHTEEIDNQINKFRVNKADELAVSEGKVYEVDGNIIPRSELVDKLYDNDFISNIQEGKSTVKVEGDDEIAALTERQINAGGQLGDVAQSFAAGAIDFKTNVEGVPQLLFKSVGIIPTDVEVPNISMGSGLPYMPSSERKKSKEFREKVRAYDEGITESLLNGNVTNAAAQTTNLIAESAPYTAAMMATGGASLPLQASAFIPISASGQMIDLKNREGMTPVEKVINSWGYGAFEFGGERLTTKILAKQFKGFAADSKSIYMNAIKKGASEEVAKEYAKKITLDRALKTVGNLGLGSVEEGLSETSTQLGQMITDELTNAASYTEDDYVNMLSKAFEGGFFSGAGMNTIAATSGAAMDRLSNESYKKSLASAQELNETIQKSENKPEQEALMELRNEEMGKAISEAEKAEKTAEKLTSEEKVRVTDIQREIDGLSRGYNEVEGESAKVAIEEKINSLYEEKDGILNKEVRLQPDKTDEKVRVEPDKKLQDDQATTPTQPNTKESQAVQTESEMAQQEEGTTETVDEGDKAVAEESGVEPSKQRVLDEIEGIRDRVNERKGDDKLNRFREDAISYLQGTKWYESASDIDREQAVRDINEMTFKKEKKAPSVKRILGAPKDNKLSVNERVALKNQIRLEARAAKDRKKAQNTLEKNIIRDTKSLVEKGEISAKQANSITKRFSKVDIDNPSSVHDYIEYVSKVYQNADYQNDISTANADRKRIKATSKSKNNQASDNEIAKKFLLVNPKTVEDIKEYLEYSKKIKSVTSPSKASGFKAKVQGTESYNEINKYIEKAIKENDKAIKDKQLAINEDLVEAGVIDESMSSEDISTVLEALEDDAKDITDDRSRYVNAYIDKMKDVFAPIMRKIANTNRDPFTEEEYGFNSEELNNIKRLSEINLDNLDRATRLRAIKAMSNIQENGVFDGVEAILREAEGYENQKRFSRKNKAQRFQMVSKLPFDQIWAKSYGQNVMSVPLFTENIYRSTETSDALFREMGYTSFIKGRRKAIVDTVKDIESFQNKFKDDFTEEQIAEMSIYAFMIRRDANNKESEFERRKNLQLESIEKKKSSLNTSLQELSDVERKVYNEMVADANSVEELKVSEKSKEIVDWFVDKFKNERPQLEKVSREVHNAILSIDENYLPDVFKSVDEGSLTENLEDMKASAFFSNSDFVNKRKASLLMEATKPNKLPKGRVLSGSFISDMFRKLEDARTDVNTSGSVIQIDSFMKGEDFKKSFIDPKDYEIFNKKIVRSVAVGKNALGGESSDFKAMINAIGNISSTMALGGVTQPLKQVIPVVANTVANLPNLSKAHFASLSDMKAAEKLLRNSTVATRGQSARIDADSEIKKLERGFSKSKGWAKKASKIIEKNSDRWLKTFLENSDVTVAEWSWVTYYASYLKNEGVKNIDWDKESESPNEKAATFADNMVDRQQNVSMSELQGMMYSSPDEKVQFLRKTLIPFSSFTYNLKSRLWTDVTIMSSPSSSSFEKQKAFKSVIGAMTEIAVFSSVNGLISYSLYSLIALSMGDEPEDYDKFSQRNKGYMAGNFVVDLFSPAPQLDPTVKQGANYVIKQIYGEEFDPETSFQLIDYKPKGQFGQLSIPLNKVSEIPQFLDMATGDSFSYENFIGKEQTKSLSEEDKAIAATAGLLYTLYVSGLMPNEVGRASMYVRRSLQKKAKTPQKKTKNSIKGKSNIDFSKY